MELFFILMLFVVLSAASAFGLTADSRDSADWKPSRSGWRAPN